MALLPSIFNDVLGPVMRGPSSSHTAGSHRIGSLLRDLAGGIPEKARFEFHPGGSLETTYHTQGSDMGLAAGLMGMEMTDERIPDAVRIAREKNIELEFVITAYEAHHPNTYRCIVTKNGKTCRMTALSTGGGMIEVVEIEGQKVSYHGDYPLTLSVQGETRTLHPVLPVPTPEEKAVLPFYKAEDLWQMESSLQKPLSESAREYESARSGLTIGILDQMMLDLIAIWKDAISNGLGGTSYDDRLVGSQSPRFEELRKGKQLIEVGPLNRMISYSTAIMETKSSMGVIIAAPTAGAAGGLPGCLIGMADHAGLDDQTLLEGFWAAGLAGLFIAADATFAAEVAGCQAETGAGGAMAAAGLVEMMQGNARQAMDAASVALQNVMGLICDPVANRVEIPCLGRNAQATANALTAANMILGGMDAIIPFHESIVTMIEVGKALPHTLRCTALGGLAVTPTAKALERKLLENRG